MSNFDGGSAFPVPCVPAEHAVEFGMTLRDYFAAKAMQSLLSVDDIVLPGYEHTLGRRATQAYLMADAMLAARGQ